MSTKRILRGLRMYSISPTLAFILFPYVTFTHLFWFILTEIFLLLQSFGPAELAIAAIVASVIFVWLATLPYLSWSLIKFISKN